VTDGYAPLTSPHPPDWSWRSVKRRNDTGFSRIPSRLAHRARPIRQCSADPTSSRLLPPSPATPGSGCLQLHPTATTAGRWRSFTSIRNNSASRRTFCLITTLLDHEFAPAVELAAAYAQRWEIELSFDEIEIHQTGGDRVLRSRTPELVKQEIWSLLAYITRYGTS
jgi:IS4 transposase